MKKSSGDVFYSYDDSLSFVNILQLLIKGKKTIIACLASFFLLSIIFAYTLPETWIVKVRLIAPEKSDYADFSGQVSSMRFFFDDVKEWGDFSKISKGDEILKSYGMYFGDSENKQQFFAESPEIQEYFSRKGLSEEAQKRKIDLWIGGFAAKALRPENVPQEFEVIFSAPTQEEAALVMKTYLSYSSSQHAFFLQQQLKSFVQRKKKEMLATSKVLAAQAFGIAEREIAKAEISLKVAKMAGIENPVPGFSDTASPMDVNAGAKVLSGKIQVLKDLKDFSILDPRMAKYKGLMKALESLSLDSLDSTKSFKFINKPNYSPVLARPKRVVIVILGIIMGFVVGVGLVFVRNYAHNFLTK